MPGSDPDLEIRRDGSQKLIELSDGEGLRNPTGIVGTKDQIVLVDGNQVISTSTDGTVAWRKSLDEDGVFFYDIEALDEATLLVSDFGRGVFVRVASDAGTIQPYLPEIQISGLARFELDGDKIFAASWGADDAWDSAVYRVSDLEDIAMTEKLSDGFGNLESVEVIDGQVILGAYRGHGDHQTTKLLKLDASEKVKPLQLGSDTQGVSDIYFDGKRVWLTHFYDASFSAHPAEHVSVVRRDN